MKDTWFVFDFDSTFTQVEAMEELAAISLANDPDKDLLIEKIKQLTDLAMEGKMPFSKSLKARIALLSAKKYHLNMLVNRLRKRVSTSFSRNKAFFKAHKGRVIIISGGFKEFIEPVVKPYFIEPDCVFANTFVFDKKNNIIGANEQNPLAQELGKVKLLRQLKLSGNIVMVGDGYTDFQVYESGIAHEFYAYTENISRAIVVEQSALVAPSLDEILFQHKLPMALSYPKTRIKALLWGEETWQAEAALKREGYQITKLKGLVEPKLLQKAYMQSSLLLFSPNNANLERQLKACAQNGHWPMCAGIWGEWDQTEIYRNWAKNGLAVFASSYAHTRSVAELALMHLLHLNRFKGEELLGKRLGIIGYGHSGSLLSVMAAHLGVEVYYYDLDDKPAMGNAKRVKQLPELLRKCELVVLTAGSRFTKELIIGTKEIKAMQNGALLVQLSYDSHVDLAAVKEALHQQKLGGYAADFIEEDARKLFAKLPNVQVSYMARLATKQTQENIATSLTERLLGFMNKGDTQGSINFPEMQLPALQHSHRFIHVHQNKPGVLAQINSILAAHKINVSGQYLKTNEQIGYVITDVSKEYPSKAIADLKAIAETIKFRVLY